MKVLAIDDEPLALRQLAAYIEKIPFFTLAGICGSAIEAKQMMDQDDVDAIFCDINMPDLNGMDFVKSIAAPPIIVFTTAYSQYAIEGYKVNAVDYLLKPFGLDEFKRAANKVKQVYDTQQAAYGRGGAESEPIKEASELGGDADTIFVKSDSRIIRISIQDIRYVEGMSEYVKIYLDSIPKPVVVLLSMKGMEERLPGEFMRVHRSYIINLKKIVEVNKKGVIMNDNAFLPIGDLYKEAFAEYLNQRFWSK